MNVLRTTQSTYDEEPFKGGTDQNTANAANSPMVRASQQDSQSVRREGTEEIRFRHLLDKISKGEEQALTEFYEVFESRIYAFILSRLHDSFEASDILNEVMWEVWRGAMRFDGRASVLTWVFSITNHKIIDRLRSNCKYEVGELSSEIPDEYSQSLDDMVNVKQEGEHLRHWLSKLSDVHRQVIHLAFFEDFSQKEISEIIGCPEGTVRARMFYAKRALKQYLENDVKRD